VEPDKREMTSRKEGTLWQVLISWDTSTVPLLLYVFDAYEDEMVGSATASSPL
jgi:hypothetical protein